jgi:hypothetical protein
MLGEALNLRLFRGTSCVEMCLSDLFLGICAADFLHFAVAAPKD